MSHKYDILTFMTYWHDTYDKLIPTSVIAETGRNAVQPVDSEGFDKAQISWRDWRTTFRQVEEFTAGEYVQA